MSTKPTFKIIVEQDGMRLEVFLTDSGGLAFHMTNTDETIGAYIEADAFRFEEGLKALLDTIDDDQEHDHCGCGHNHHHDDDEDSSL
ncbi:MAG: hypothetical protein FD169_1972 [Bacillota bacterium]|nr:MAG: hypothetical protein FD169_1972 [Bacillota bacterium]MBS3949886.1 hypothetical protein [Peptococcaceae bacterium]